MPEKIIIAIDGASGSGKSTLAKGLAKSLHFVYIDTGAMYRAVTWQIMNNNIDINDLEGVKKILAEVTIIFQEEASGIKKIFTNGTEVTELIRTQKVTRKVSYVSKIPQVRKKMVQLQRQQGKQGNVILEGRDIGTVVFPEADIKFFIKASLEVRAQRRLQELREKNISLKQVKDTIKKRDYIDTTREESPLIKASDAIEIDSTNICIAETLKLALGYVRDRFPHLVIES